MLLEDTTFTIQHATNYKYWFVSSCYGRLNMQQFFLRHDVHQMTENSYSCIVKYDANKNYMK